MIAPWFTLLWLAVSPFATPLPVIRANHNDRPAGSLAGGGLTLRLVARDGVWHPEAEDGVGIPVRAFAEEGRALESPGPLIRVPEGTELRIRVRNAISGATLVVHGLTTHPDAAADSLVIASGGDQTCWGGCRSRCADTVATNCSVASTCGQCPTGSSTSSALRIAASSREPSIGIGSYVP